MQNLLIPADGKNYRWRLVIRNLSVYLCASSQGVLSPTLDYRQEFA